MKKQRIFIIVALVIVFAINPVLGLIVMTWMFIKYTIQKANGNNGKTENKASGQWVNQEWKQSEKKQQGLDSSMKMHADNSYDVNKKADYHGVSKENRDRSYTTRELYEEIANRKTDYRGVNKDLL